MFTCPCCYLSRMRETPHGDEPCPQAISLRLAEIAEKLQHVELMKAQTKATMTKVG